MRVVMGAPRRERKKLKKYVCAPSGWVFQRELFIESAKKVRFSSLRRYKSIDIIGRTVRTA